MNLESKQPLILKKLLSNSNVKDVILRMGSSAEDAQFGFSTKNNLASIAVVFKKGTDIDQYIKELKKGRQTLNQPNSIIQRQAILVLAVETACNLT